MRKELKLPEIAQKVIIFNSRGQVLLLQNSGYYSKRYWKAWDVPGGRLKEGEELLDGLKREVAEETGIDLESPILVMPDTVRFDDGKKRLFLIYFAETEKDEVQLSNEHERFIWVDPEDVPDVVQFRQTKTWVARAVETRKIVQSAIANV